VVDNCHLMTIMAIFPTPLVAPSIRVFSTLSYSCHN